MEGFFMPIKPEATRQVYYPLLDLRKKVNPSFENFNPCLSS